MGLAVGQLMTLTLTRRKADCEREMSAISMRKMILAKEMSDLTRLYQNRISQKQVVYYDSGKYHKINYSYLMGYDSPLTNIDAILHGERPLKDNNKMVLADYEGHVVLSDRYAQAIMSVCGVGLGENFSDSDIPEILAQVAPRFEADEYRDGIASYTWDATTYNPVSGETGSTEGDSTDNLNESLQRIIDFYYPIFKAAATNGWTTEYNANMRTNSNYLTDALSSGTLILAEINQYGYYDENTSLTYFQTSGDIEMETDADKRKELDVWYNAEKERINEKENFMNMELTDLSTELEAIKTQIESVKSFVDDATQTIFNWGSA